MRRWPHQLPSEKKYRRWPLSNDKKGRIHEIRGKKYMVLSQVQIPILYFHPDTPKAVWLEQ